MSLSRNEIEEALKQWNHAWDNHDLEGVMALFHKGVKSTLDSCDDLGIITLCQGH